MVVVVVREAAILLCMSTSKRHVGLTADDRLDAYILRFAIKLHRSEHVAMIGHGHRRLVEGFNLFDERFDLIRTVEKAKLCVEMKMNEGGCHGGILWG